MTPKASRSLASWAEDVEKVNPALITRDREGKAYTVRYDAVNAMLLNEFLKEHGKVEKLEATAAQQKVSAQLEVSKPAPQTVLNISKAAQAKTSSIWQSAVTLRRGALSALLTNYQSSIRSDPSWPHMFFS